ncbi:MAG: GNAT family protein [Ferruginibacter sp.]
MLSPNFSPFPTIETERLLLREVTVNDVAEMYFLRSSRIVTEHFNRAPDASLEETKLKIDQILESQKKNENVFWVIAFRSEPGKMIGNIGYWNIVNEHYRAEIGYLLNPDHWRKGIMKEALIAVVDHGFNKIKLHSIEANINPDNAASGYLLESCGFVKEAHHKENYYYDGVFYDSIIYSLINKKR